MQVHVMMICMLTHWGRVTHICVSKLTIIGSDNDLSPGRRQAIIWTNAGFLLNGPLGTNFSEILIEIHTFSFKKMHWKMSSGKWRPFCLGLNVLIREVRINSLKPRKNICRYENKLYFMILSNFFICLAKFCLNVCLGVSLFTHWGKINMAAVLQMTF